MSPDALRGMARRLLRGTNRLIRALREDDISLLAAAIAFYGILSISPILVFAVAIAGFVMSEKAVLDEAMDAVAANVGPDAAETLSHSVSQWRDFGQTPWTMITAVLVTLYASTRLFAQMQTALNTIWHADGEGPAGWWLELRGRLLGLVIVAVLGAVLVLGVAAKVGLGALAQYLGEAPWLFHAADWVLSVALLALVVFTIYRRLPAARVPRGIALRGALATAGLLVLGSEGVAWYLREVAPASSFGAAGSLIALVLWIYYAALIFLFGAELTWLWAQDHADWRPRPRLRPWRRRRGSREEGSDGGEGDGGGGDESGGDESGGDESGGDESGGDESGGDDTPAAA
ncbi:MAG: hypothetical protein CMH59_09280 [Myxococcales bacterium]|nr:hypothetical protein [Myxococcales bacterium]